MRARMTIQTRRVVFFYYFIQSLIQMARPINHSRLLSSPAMMAMLPCRSYRTASFLFYHPSLALALHFPVKAGFTL